MIELKLTPVCFKEILTKGYSLDGIYLMKMLKEGYIMEEIFGDIPKITNIGQSLVRKGLVTIDGIITKEGESILDFLSSTEEIPKLARKKRTIATTVEDAFTRWWKEYPPSDAFDYKGRKFKGTRALRVKKADCEKKLNNILASGECNIDELIMALKLEISQKAENSMKTNTNKMSYFQNSLTYLNQGTWDVYVELVRKGHKPEEDTKTQVTNETFI